MPVLPPVSGPATEPAAYLAQSKEKAILVSTGIIGALALTVVLLRVYVRAKILKNLGKDDISMVLAMVLGVVVYICFVGESYHGLGRHFIGLPPDDIEHFLRWQAAQILAMIVGVALCKVSIALLLIRLVPSGRMSRCLWGLIALLTVFNTASLLFILLGCRPIHAYWDLKIAETAKCVGLHTFLKLGIVYSALTMATDVALAVLPIPIVLKLSLDRRTKTALCFVLGLGFLTVGAGAIKTHALVIYSPDALYHDRAMVWSALELYMGILAASLPTLKPLLVSFFTTVTSTSGSSDVPQAARRYARPVYLNKDSQLSTQIFAEYCQGVYPPEPAHGKSYLGFFRRGDRNGALQTASLRSASHPLGPVTWTEPPPLPTVDMNERQIVRTTRVITTSELRSESQSSEDTDDQWPLKDQISLSSFDKGLKPSNSRSVLQLSRNDTEDSYPSVHYLVEKD